jgi:hypothetical protein
MEYVSNYHERNLTYGYELSEKERKGFDYLDNDNFDMHDFLRYRGELYDIEEFTTLEHPYWQGVRADTYFSGIVVRFTDDGESVIVGRCYTEY